MPCVGMIGTYRGFTWNMLLNEKLVMQLPLWGGAEDRDVDYHLSKRCSEAALNGSLPVVVQGRSRSSYYTASKLESCAVLEIVLYN